MSRKLINDENAAATEIGYVFTFLLGLMFLTTFSIWVWGLEFQPKSVGPNMHWRKICYRLVQQ